MKNFYKIFFFLMIPLILVAQESSEVREMTEDEIKDYRENHYCVVTNTKGKFTGLENCDEGMTAWFITGYNGMENGELAVKFCDFNKTIATPRMNPNYNLVCVFKKNRNKSNTVFVN